MNDMVISIEDCVALPRPTGDVSLTRVVENGIEVGVGVVGVWPGPGFDVRR